MQYVADFHIHSKYSRATSPQLEMESINHWALAKGVNIINAPDFTHPVWLADMKEKLERHDNGLYQLREDFVFRESFPKHLPGPVSGGTPETHRYRSGESVWFIPVTEVSCIYHQNKKLRKVHLLVFLPDWKTVDEFNRILESRGANLTEDGRPMLKLSARDILRIMLDISDESMLVPAHAWTPWFAVFGSQSGFDSLEECFGELTPEVRAIETGLSSDPPMNWRLSALDNITLISNSDAHSPWHFAREANVFEIDPDKLSYQEIIRIIKEKDRSKFLYTLEFFPQEGKYHYDGHRDCGIRFPPEETRKHHGICPVCGKPLTIGVMNRVDALADRPDGYTSDRVIPYKNVVGLSLIIAESLGVKSETSKRVADEYNKLISRDRNELDILLNLSLDELKEMTLPRVVDGIRRLREGRLSIEPGYDGVYGTVRIFP